MAEPSPMEQQQDLMRQIMQWLMSLESPADWEARTLRVQPTASAIPFVLTEHVGDQQGGASGVLPPDVAGSVYELQRVMFQPDKGSWLVAVLGVTSEGRGDAQFNYDQQPVDDEGRPSLSAQDVREHLQAYPRSAEHLPDWMRVG